MKRLFALLSAGSVLAATDEPAAMTEYDNRCYACLHNDGYYCSAANTCFDQTLTASDCKNNLIVEDFRYCSDTFEDCDKIDIKDSNAGSDTTEKRSLPPGRACKFLINNA